MFGVLRGRGPGLGAVLDVITRVGRKPPSLLVHGSYGDDHLTSPDAGSIYGNSLRRGRQRHLVGLGGRDFLRGEQVEDNIYGGDNDDGMYGGAGKDLLDGGIGDDGTEGGRGTDTWGVPWNARLCRDPRAGEVRLSAASRTREGPDASS